MTMNDSIRVFEKVRDTMKQAIIDETIALLQDEFLEISNDANKLAIDYDNRSYYCEGILNSRQIASLEGEEFDLEDKKLGELENAVVTAGMELEKALFAYDENVHICSGVWANHLITITIEFMDMTIEVALPNTFNK